MQFARAHRQSKCEMSQTVIEAFYLGTVADLDPDEGNYLVENAGSLGGTTFGSGADPLYKDLETLTLDNPNSDAYIDSNDNGAAGEDLIFAGTASTLDSVIEYSVTITYNDGSTATTEMLILQDESGRLFLSPYQEGRAENDVLNDGGITSITLDSVVWADYEGIYADIEQDAFIVCFASGTLIETDTGPTDVAHLSVWDRVRTMDNGFQPIRWIAARRVRASGDFAPVRIAAGALGGGLPMRDLRVSPQHRILIRSKIAQRMFHCPEVLVPAKKLLSLPGIEIDTSTRFVTYWHFLCDRHEIVFSEGAATESLFTGLEAFKAVGPEARREISALFPGLPAGLTPARLIIRGRQQKRLIDRHQKNAQAIYQT